MSGKNRLKITFNAPLVLIFALACTAATVAGVISGGESSALLFSTRSASFSDPLTWLRLFTHVLGHADWAHLVGNMCYILLLGPMLEEKYGWKKLLAVILVTAVITGLCFNLLFPGRALLGASGVVFAFILLTSFSSFKEGEIPVTFLLVAVIYLGQQIWEGITVRDNVSNLTHILGGVVGGVSGFLLNRKKGTSF